MRRTILITAFILTLSLGSGAYAVSKIGAKDIKRNAVHSRHIKNGSVRVADLSPAARTRTLGTAGPKGATGPRGARGPRGRRGTTGAAGPAGPAGPAGTFSDTLPSGKTARGTFVFEHSPSGEDETADTTASFPFALGAAPTPHVIAAGTAAPAECPGSAADPKAAAGHLCVYEASAQGLLKARTTYDPAKEFAAGTAGQYGFALRYTLGVGPGPHRAHGTWAVTAP
jgi:hypothetical protein